MKIRNDYVTNSSSSSYVIAYRTHKAIDEDTLIKYPFLRNYDRLLERILLTAGYNETTTGKIFKSKEEYDEHFVACYGWRECNTVEKILKDDDYLVDMYNKAVEYLGKGFNILYKDVDYCDDYCSAMLHELESEDFIILEAD